MPFLPGAQFAPVAALVNAFLVGLLVCSCGGDSSPGRGGDPVDGGDADTDAGLDLLDAGDVAQTDTQPFEPAPTAAVAELELFPVYDWVTANVTAAPDTVIARLNAGSFEMPEPGVDENGVNWTRHTLGENGELANYRGGLMYAAAEFYTADAVPLVVRADSVIEVYLNGAIQPGDVYHTRQMRVPLLTQAGNNVVVVRAGAGRRVPEIWFETTPDEIYVNLGDRTVPQLLEGDQSTQYIGAAFLNLLDRPLLDLAAVVVESEHFEEARLEYPAIAAGATTQLSWELVPKAEWEHLEEETVPLTLRVEAPGLSWSYEVETELGTAAVETHYRRSFRSRIDHSTQYYGVAPPTDFDPDREYAMVLSLHGAGVQALGQARSYSLKDWGYLVAATNRRPFGFDWEVWGRLDGIEVLDLAQEHFGTAPTQAYVTGHSMGGHGTWQLGTLFPGRFAVVGPSAGWSSFYSYAGSTPPTGSFGRASASSQTNNYVSNLARRAVYIIHGDADDNVPVREGRDMFELVSQVTDDIAYHEQPGAGHWWNGDVSAGVDCVDWTPLFDLMQERRLDPFELDFDFTTPSPWVNPSHSYLVIGSVSDPMSDASAHSSFNDGELTLDTDNVRSMTIDGSALVARDVTSLVVDGDDVSVTDGLIEIGDQEGKNPTTHGPFNQVMERPFCFVYPADGPEAYRHYAAYMLSNWAIIGNGHGCALADSDLTPEIRSDYNLIHLGGDYEALADDVPEGIRWSEGDLQLGSQSWTNAAGLFVFPEEGHLSAVMTAPAGYEHLLFGIMPFSSRFVVPDYLVWSDSGGIVAGFFNGDWSL